MTSDRVSNFIVSLKNAGAVGKESVTVPFSKFILSIAELLEKEGYVKSTSKKGKKYGKFVEVELLYKDGVPAITHAKRISSFSTRVYRGAKDMPTVRNGFGIAAISTTKGILTDKEARKQNIGGEVLFEIW